jgi:DNA-binding response OmpR family regulator
MPRLLWVAHAAPSRDVAAAFSQAGWQLLHLDASAGTVGWVRTLAHDALLLHQQAQLTPLLAPLRQATSAPLLVLGMLPDESGQLALYEQGVDALLGSDATPRLLLARVKGLLRRCAPPDAAPRLVADAADMGGVDALIARLRRRLDALPGPRLRIEEVPGVGYSLHVRTS